MRHAVEKQEFYDFAAHLHSLALLQGKCACGASVDCAPLSEEFFGSRL
jgi:hypothetical protein